MDNESMGHMGHKPKIGTSDNTNQQYVSSTFGPLDMLGMLDEILPV